VDHQARFLLREFEGKRGDSDAQGLVKLVHQGQRKLSMVEIMMDDVSTSRIDLVLGLCACPRLPVPHSHTPTVSLSLVPSSATSLFRACPASGLCTDTRLPHGPLSLVCR